MPKVGAGDYTDLIIYKDALRRINPNFDQDEPLMKEWVLKNAKARNVTETFSTVSMSVRSF